MFNKSTLLFGKKSKWWTHMLYYDQDLGRLNIFPNRVVASVPGVPNAVFVLQFCFLDAGKFISTFVSDDLVDNEDISNEHEFLWGYLAEEKNGAVMPLYFEQGAFDPQTGEFSVSGRMQAATFPKLYRAFVQPAGMNETPIYLSSTPPHGTQVNAANDEFFAEEAVC